MELAFQKIFGHSLEQFDPKPAGTFFHSGVYLFVIFYFGDKLGSIEVDPPKARGIVVPFVIRNHKNVPFLS